jgi:hypothetical protein
MPFKCTSHDIAEFCLKSLQPEHTSRERARAICLLFAVLSIQSYGVSDKQDRPKLQVEVGWGVLSQEGIVNQKLTVGSGSFGVFVALPRERCMYDG